jgi:hypothetical protein
MLLQAAHVRSLRAACYTQLSAYSGTFGESSLFLTFCKDSLGGTVQLVSDSRSDSPPDTMHQAPDLVS